MNKRSDFYKEQYYFELTRKNSLTTSLSIPIAFMTAIFTAYAYLGLNIYCLFDTWLIWVFLLFILIASLFVVKASIYLYKAFTGLKYGYLPSPDKIYEYENKYKNDPDLDKKFFEGIKRSYINTTSKNRLNNNFRVTNLFKANINTIKAIIFVILASIPFFLAKNNENILLKANINLEKNLKPMIPNEQKPSHTSENEDQSNQPDISDFPVDEYITESAEINIPTEHPDTIQKDSDQNSDSKD